MPDLWAWSIFTAVRVMVSKMRMVPVEEVWEGGGGCVDNGEEAVGMGAG